MSDSKIKTLEEKLIDLEIRLTHQEDHIHSLDKVIYDQDKTITALTERVELLEKKLKAAGEQQILSPHEDTPPPHY